MFLFFSMCIFGEFSIPEATWVWLADESSETIYCGQTLQGHETHPDSDSTRTALFWLSLGSFGEPIKHGWQKQNPFQTFGHQPGATSITATKPFVRPLCRLLSGFKGGSEQRLAGWSKKLRESPRSFGLHRWHLVLWSWFLLTNWVMLRSTRTQLLGNQGVQASQNWGFLALSSQFYWSITWHFCTPPLSYGISAPRLLHTEWSTAGAASRYASFPSCDSYAYAFQPI